MNASELVQKIAANQIAVPLPLRFFRGISREICSNILSPDLTINGSQVPASGVLYRGNVWLNNPNTNTRSFQQRSFPYERTFEKSINVDRTFLPPGTAPLQLAAKDIFELPGNWPGEIADIELLEERFLLVLMRTTSLASWLFAIDLNRDLPNRFLIGTKTLPNGAALTLPGKLSVVGRRAFVTYLGYTPPNQQSRIPAVARYDFTDIEERIANGTPFPTTVFNVTANQTAVIARTPTSVTEVGGRTYISFFPSTSQAQVGTSAGVTFDPDALFNTAALVPGSQGNLFNDTTIGQAGNMKGFLHSFNSADPNEPPTQVVWPDERGPIRAMQPLCGNRLAAMFAFHPPVSPDAKITIAPTADIAIARVSPLPPSQSHPQALLTRVTTMGVLPSWKGRNATYLSKFIMLGDHLVTVGNLNGTPSAAIFVKRSRAEATGVSETLVAEGELMKQYIENHIWNLNAGERLVSFTGAYYDIFAATHQAGAGSKIYKLRPFQTITASGRCKFVRKGTPPRTFWSCR